MNYLLTILIIAVLRIAGDDLAFACHHSQCDPANERDHFGGLRQR
jgi:hypothetical protein